VRLGTCGARLGSSGERAARGRLESRAQSDSNAGVSPRPAPRHQTLGSGLLIAGRYRVERMLGRGGVATVYAVRDEHDGEPLALKYLTLDRARPDQQLLALLQREYHTLAQITHPGIVRVFDFGLHEGDAFYTMELLDGEDLSDAARLAWPAACEVLRQVASALAILHARRLIHRDVSHRNVRLTAQAGAKLIDFGAMMPMGFALDVVGTPPFLSPEAVHGEPLDQRADLYALGALAYFLLAGRHAYTARSLGELREAWARGDARPLAELEPELPGALSRLVMALIARDPGARPSSMAEVIDALRAAAGLQRVDEAGVARAYLAKPKLIGVEGVLRRLGAGLDHALDGPGGVLLIEGSFGTGKSRILQEVVLSAKLRGANVVQLRAHAASGAAYALARELVDALLRELPHAEALLSSERRAAFAWLLPRLREHAASKAGALPENPQEVRARVHAELLAFVRELGARGRLVIAIDDVHRGDDASLGLFAALPRSASAAAGADLASPTLVCSLLTADAGTQALRSLRSRATLRAQLRGFDLAETEQLVAGFFGASARSRQVASWMHAHTQGNPLECSELARHLVEGGTAYYADAAWVLPERLPTDVPRGLGAAFEARVAALPPAARALAELLALLDAPASLALCGQCSELAQPALFRALEQLVAAELVLARGDRYSIARAAIRDALLRALTPERRRVLHQRVGEALLAQALARPSPHRAELLAAAQQLLAGESPLEGVSVLERAVPRGQALAELGEAVVPALERALELCATLDQPPARALRLRVHLATCAFLYDRRLIVHVDPLLARLRSDSGIADWVRDDPTPEGLWLAVRRADQRFQHTPEQERGLPPMQALITLAATASSTLGVAVLERDLARVEQLATLVAPLGLLDKTQGLALVHDLVMAVREAMRGHALRADALREALFVRLRDPQMYVGVTTEMRNGMLATQLHAMGVRRAAYDETRALAIADEIDALGLRMYAGAALQIRMLVQLYRGDPRGAAEHAARMGALALLGGPGRQTEVWLLGNLVGAHGALFDAMALKRTAERIAALAGDSPGYRVLLYCTLGAYYRERGQLERARDTLERALALAPPGEHAYYGTAAFELCKTLVAAGEHTQAVQLADHSYAVLADTLEEAEVVALRLWPAVAESEVAVGRAEQARMRLQRVLAHVERGGVPLTRCAAVHEALARVALACGDRAGFDRHVAEAAGLYRSLDHAGLLARLSAWSDALGRAAGLPSAAVRVEDSTSMATVEDRPEHPLLRQLRAAGPSDRPQRALAWLLGQQRVAQGMLFLASPRGVRLAAAIGPNPLPGREPERVTADLIEALPALLDAREAGTRDDGEPSEPALWLDGDGVAQRILPLVYFDGMRRHALGAALVPADAVPAPAGTATLLARALHEAGEASIPDSLDAWLPR
jgi:tetratricopeptide (TPR) repeat protein